MSQAADEPIHAAISYSRADQSRVEALLSSLKARGLVIWFDKDIPGGALWEEIIAKKYRASGALLFFVSKASLESQRCSEEVSTARTLGKPIIPVLLDPLKLPDDLPDRFVLTLQARNTVDAFERNQEEVETAILKALDGFGIRPGAVPVIAPPPKSTPRPAHTPTPAALPSRSGSGRMIAIGGALLAVLLVIGGYFAFVRDSADKAPSAGVSAPAATTASVPSTVTSQPADKPAEPPVEVADAPPPSTPDATPPPPTPAPAPAEPAPTTATPAADATGKLTMEKSSYPVGYPIKIRVADLPGDDGDYVAIAVAGSAPTDYVSRKGSEGATAKALTLQPVMKPGDYELRLFYGTDVVNGGAPVVRASLPFKVTPAEPVTIALGKESYAEGERIVVSYKGMPGNERDWISVAKSDAGESSYVAYEYTGGNKEGTLSIRPMVQPGEYEVRVYFDDTTGDKKVRTRQVFQVTPAPPVVGALDANSYVPGSVIKVSYSSMPGNERDWFSLAKAGTADTAYITYVYTGGPSSGQVELKAPDEPGAYEIRGYFDDGTGDKTVRVRLPFTVAAAATAGDPAAPKN
ncbi:MAG: TIR domain-containing protein [Alphaproteobacteria bacterium]|nr:TIR domain-containing protein [Alphaproteobacteria bacterium]